MSLKTKKGFRNKIILAIVIISIIIFASFKFFDKYNSGKIDKILASENVLEWYGYGISVPYEDRNSISGGLEFEFNYKHEAKDGREEVDDRFREIVKRIDFYDINKTLIYSCQNNLKYYSYSFEENSVGCIIEKGIFDNDAIKFSAVLYDNKGNILYILKNVDLKNNPYELVLELHTPVSKFGIPTKIGFQSQINFEKCILMDNYLDGYEIVSLGSGSSKSIDLENVKSETESVYARCYTEDGGRLDSNTIETKIIKEYQDKLKN